MTKYTYQVEVHVDDNGEAYSFVYGGGDSGEVAGQGPGTIEDVCQAAAQAIAQDVRQDMGEEGLAK